MIWDGSNSSLSRTSSNKYTHSYLKWCDTDRTHPDLEHLVTSTDTRHWRNRFEVEPPARWDQVRPHRVPHCKNNKKDMEALWHSCFCSLLRKAFYFMLITISIWNLTRMFKHEILIDAFKSRNFSDFPLSFIVAKLVWNVYKDASRK